MSTTRPMTSSATAAPSTIRASVVASARRSPNTRAVMPTLVAVRAAPTNRAVLKSSPISRIAPSPSTSGATTPTVADQQRRAADLAQLAEVHLHADLEQQEDDADLAERAEHLVVAADQVEHRRADEDAGDDLADDGRDADALGDLGRQLGGDEDDQDVAEDLGDVHAAGQSRGQGRATGRARSAVPAQWSLRMGRVGRRRAAPRACGLPRDGADERTLADLRVRALDGDSNSG